jgi:hypothetical protein
LVSTQLKASSFSIGDAPDRRTHFEPASTFSLKDPMIEASNASFEPMRRNRVPWPSPAAAAMFRTDVPS